MRVTVLQVGTGEVFMRDSRLMAEYVRMDSGLLAHVAIIDLRGVSL